eukprot:TRINITY_DN10816_c1_g1_i1.p1 TRINITY_DN10816_c1_g1~~TRINITY_DN10816_c1_g1_i1.p1  ORF type:complete len:624 (+),score=84.70 TRINITY_DN10816_c1_g1_i1:142-1872(+)
MAISVLLLIRWLWFSANPMIDEMWPKATLGLLGTLASVWLTWEIPESEIRLRLWRAEHAAQAARSPSGERQRPDQPSASFFHILGVGLMGGSGLFLFQTYLSSFDVAASSTSSNPSAAESLVSMGAFVSGVLVLSLQASWWLDFSLATIFAGMAPLVACGLQLWPGESIEMWGPVLGTGTHAFLGQVLLMAAFPQMLVLFGRKLSELALLGAAGRCLFVSSAIWSLSYAAYLAVLFGGGAPCCGATFKGKPWRLSVLLALAWSGGLAVSSFREERGRQGEEELKQEQQSLQRRLHHGRDLYADGSRVILFMLAVFAVATMPLRLTNGKEDVPESDELRVISYNVQQGFDWHGSSNVNCVTDTIRSADAALVALSESNSVHPLLGNRDISLIYAAQLKMGRLQGVPGALVAPGSALLSKLPVQDSSASAWETSEGCRSCPSQTYVWVHSTVSWQKKLIEFHTVHLDLVGNLSAPIEAIAAEIRTRFRTRPMVLVVEVGVLKDLSSSPWGTALRGLLKGTGLEEAHGAPNATDLSSVRSNSVFFRGLDLVDSHTILANCSAHMPLLATFRLPGAMLAS